MTFIADLYAAIFGAPTRAAPPVPAVAPAKARRAWVPGPPKHAVKRSALPIGDATHHDCGSGSGFMIGIVGESYRQAALHALDHGRLRRGVRVTLTASLIPEPENPYDPQAIRVDIEGAHVGYLSRADAVWYQPVFAALAAQQLIAVARAKLMGGVADKPSIGVILDLDTPEDLVRALAPPGQPF